MKHVDKKAVLERAKAEKKKTPANFRFDPLVYKAFVEQCIKDGVAVTRVLEELMRDYLK